MKAHDKKSKKQLINEYLDANPHLSKQEYLDYMTDTLHMSNNSALNYYYMYRRSVAQRVNHKSKEIVEYIAANSMESKQSIVEGLRVNFNIAQSTAISYYHKYILKVRPKIPSKKSQIFGFMNDFPNLNRREYIVNISKHFNVSENNARSYIKQYNLLYR